jgi:hypothetical protein
MLSFSQKNKPHQLVYVFFLGQKRQDTSINIYHFLIKTNMTNVHIISNLIMSSTIKMLGNVF